MVYPRNVCGSIGSGMGSTQPHEDNCVLLHMRSSKIWLGKLKLRLMDIYIIVCACACACASASARARARVRVRVCVCVGGAQTPFFHSWFL